MAGELCQLRQRRLVTSIVVSTVASDPIAGAQDDWLDDMLTGAERVADGVVMDMVVVVKLMIIDGETKLG